MKPPKCGAHVAVAMVLTEAQAPIWLLVPDGSEGSEPKCKRRMRQFWKCPITGSFRVAAYAPTEEEEKRLSSRDCPSCGEPTDADGVRRARASNLCRKCTRERKARKEAEREALRRSREVLRTRYEAEKKISGTDYDFLVSNGELAVIAVRSIEASA